MDLVEIFKIIGITAGPQILLIIVIGFWGKKIIETFFIQTIEIKKQELNKELIQYNHEIDQKSIEFKNTFEKEIELYKTSLNKLKFEFEKKYETQHLMHVEAVEKLYSGLIEIQILFKEILHSEFNEDFIIIEEKYNNLKNTIKALNQFFLIRRIYLPLGLVNNVQIIFDNIWDAQLILPTIRKFYQPPSLNVTELKAEMHKEYQENNICNYIEKELPKVIIKLEEEFRKLIT